MTQHRRRTGGQVLVDQLLAQGVERLTCVPGESYLAVLDALHDGGIDVMTCRNEGGAAMMAEAYGKLTGRPGICFVTRGPGATNASHGVHIAAQDSTPMILFIGQVARDMREREAFQEVDYKQFFGGMAKWVVEVDNAARFPELIARAFRVAMQGRPGPVVVSLPEDMLLDEVEVGDAPRVEPADIWPAPAQMAELQRLLEEAQPAARDPRRLALDGSRPRRARRLERALGAAGRHFLPPRAPFPGRSPELCRRCRHRPQPEARGPGQGGRSASPHRRPHVGDALIVLHAARHPCAGAAPRACASGSGGAGPGLRAHARHPGFARCLLRGLARDEPGADALLAQRGGRGARRLSRLVGAPDPASRGRSSMARPWSGCGTACRPMR